VGYLKKQLYSKYTVHPDSERNFENLSTYGKITALPNVKRILIIDDHLAVTDKSIAYCV